MPEHPVPQDEPATNTNTTLLESAASNDQTNDNMECAAASMKRGVHEDSSDDDIDTNLVKKSASSSPACKQPGTRVDGEVERRSDQDLFPFRP